ncbi:FAD-binding and (Fe-S)-binding domain-containing protein [Spiribacter halobius]|uniref:FAD-binding oxidoreductase n=1 Tax=Sediminicurvatus halobius TaxID=2182432 RepID=A0A2U2N6B7_9GAMM|nr:FAD-binding and (Fe-S)-binding domain-containing protein [Spiribacter halobius]PWG64617.1 FAD-binding oxidoreductase [Spiribacter halobius]UEX79060.1 FAD-binding protein [Spiribacter halobius]
MVAQPAETARSGGGTARPGDSALATRLRRELRGEVLFDAFSRGRYSTDASVYQIEPIGVVVPRDEQDVASAIAIARETGVPVLPRGGGTSQCGQTVNEALVLDCSKYMNRALSVDPERQVAVVQPGVVLDELNKSLKRHGLWYPVDVSTSAQATLGGMAGNNSCGTRSLRYGNMVHNTRAIDAVLPDGEALHFGALPPPDSIPEGSARYRELVRALHALYGRERDELAARFPDLRRRVGGYNLDRLAPEGGNLAKLLVGSEGTLAFFQRIEIDLSRLPAHKTLGICHFPTFRSAMEAAKPIVEELSPAAVELVDNTLIELGLEIDIFRPVMERYIKGRPAAALFVEFSGDDRDTEIAHLDRLAELMADLGHPDSVVKVIEPAEQGAVWGVRKAGLNIMMSMKGDGKPVSFIEDCAVPLEHLPDYTERLTAVFHKHGTEGTWYAHASEGCLHVRPIINLKEDAGARKMRAIAEEAFAMVREYKGSHSGEHGDGIVRSEFHRDMFGDRLVAAFGEVKRLFDPAGLMNPGRIVDPPRMDDRTLMRYKPGYRTIPLRTALDWTAQGGFAAAVEMCNNNGHCRKFDAAVMCPSYRATRNEQDLTRGRANSLRLALSGQLGEDALTSDDMYQTLAKCVSCKGCRRECPTGVDMAKMKVEFLHHYHARHGRSLRDRLIAHMPRYAPWASRLRWLANARDRIPGLAALSERLIGFAAARPLPRWAARPFRDEGTLAEGSRGRVVLFADTFNRWFEPRHLRDAVQVLAAGGYEVIAAPSGGGRPLCCGRTYLSVGDTDAARAEARRTIEALLPHVRAGTPVVGLEPSCLLTLRDEFRSLLPGEDSDALASHAYLLEEFLASELDAGRLELPLAPQPGRRALLHGHCHQKAFDAVRPIERVLGLIPELRVETIPGTCCGMAGAFGYQAEHHETSLAIGELDVLPAVREAEADTWIVADGTSCRHQMADGAGRGDAMHVASALAAALAPETTHG